jgi:endoglucanase
MSFERPEDHEDPYVWAPDMLGLIQKHRLHWAAWCFHPLATPRIILDWKYVPTPFWGDFVKRALAGEKFELQKMR